MRSHTQSVVIEPNRIHLLQAINSDISVLIVCNKTGGTIKGDIKKKKLAVSQRLRNGAQGEPRPCLMTDVTGHLTTTEMS